jgi:hypothetical protein
MSWSLVFLAAGGYYVYVKATTPETPVKKPDIRRVKPRYYTPLEELLSDGYNPSIKKENIVSYEASSLDGAPKTLIEGPGKVRAVARTHPGRILPTH